MLDDIWKKPLVFVGAETLYISLIYFHCVSFKNELTNLSYILSLGVNLGTHKMNLFITTRACINSIVHLMNQFVIAVKFDIEL